MKYDSFEARVLPIFIFYAVLIMLGTLVTIKLAKKYIQSKDTAPLHLFIVYAFFTASTAIVATSSSIDGTDFSSTRRLFS